ncbi:MAG: heparinase II/III family protein [Deltaproteobacteria bacterium]|nr:heparinase II/III family protein [Deltaproteobacteria bacterium]
MRLSELYSRAKSLPLHVLFLKATAMLLRLIRRRLDLIRDLLIPTLGFQPGPGDKGSSARIRQYFFAPEAFVAHEQAKFGALAAKTLNHEFDLLGSGWVRVFHGMQCKGIEDVLFPPKLNPEDNSSQNILERLNWANRANAGRIRSLISPSYKPIDWHLDFKSGFRWDEGAYWTSVPYGHLAGVDVKVPWELSRCHHLVWLAVEFVNHRDLKMSNEFRDQILDFISSNPPKFGVNWRCPMDVAIRASNWLYALDIFRSAGATFDSKFIEVLEASLYSHGNFIRHNLERGPDFRGNHYLADIAGLVFISSYLEGPKADEWLKFSAVSLLEELEYQFFEEGTNFEGSTAYHRLSSEMFIYPALLLLLLPAHKKSLISPLVSARFGGAESDLWLAVWPSFVFSRLSGMARFVMDITCPDGNIVQIGDCDNGRFLKASVRVGDELDERHLSHTHIVELIDFILNYNKNVISNFQLRSSEVAILSATFEKHNVYERTQTAETSTLPQISVPDLPENLPPLQQEYRISGVPIGELVFSPYPQFGLYIWRTNGFFLSVRCGEIGQKGRGGHDHNDQLSVELWIDSKPIIRDPGTYIYTPFPDLRNSFRSVTSHFTPHIRSAGETGDLSRGLFFIWKPVRGVCLRADVNYFLGYYIQDGNQIFREIRLERCSVVILDYSNCTLTNLEGLINAAAAAYSRGYGHRDLADQNL